MDENRTIEFKREYTEDIKKTVVAFANSDGGTIYVGIEDDGTVIGVSDADEIILQLTNSIRDGIRPDVTLFVEGSIEMMEGKKVVIATVQRGTACPYYIGKKGLRPEGVYVRQGASTVPATETAIRNMIKETSGDCFETARALEQQLTFETIEEYFRNRKVEFGEKQKVSLGLVGLDGTYTNLALLLSDQCQHTIKLAMFEGSKKTVFKERKEFTGSLIRQVEEAYEYIEHYNRTRAEFKGLERIDRKDYPVEAIREALLNAIVHRDYSYSASVLISIFEDRIEFVTVGGLVKGMIIDDILLGVSVLRNQNLGNIFYRLKLIEAYGTGIPKIMESYEGEICKPRLDVTNNAFKITLPNRNQGDSLGACETANQITEREKHVLRILAYKKFIVRKDVEEEIGVSQATAILLLREMTRKGLLTKVGSGRLVKYKTDKI
ncbi:ATP-dependent DNA helicase RecG [Aequitasia blattaphilus]|uniref:DNA binding domain-containing protein n=1 Tax=Aequitasia blattaphilus TaxID=2949332 RepID=A0ABT1EC98_9FIRM|nr:RNA-binding domain-containing protein [Aequitasia blattaphilus]MCP1103428.1 putative DNA binding domain-containing protein [Aequitasia blattaphilus]MCR8616068.1 putative DNA binding domain-containing protein [Aequitasia blattaphilus]